MTVTELVLDILGAIFIVTGGVLGYRALAGHRSPEAPERIPSWNPRDWRPAWTTRNWFYERKWFRVYVAGSLLMVLGSLLLALSFVLL
jgi:hypothetical protein